MITKAEILKRATWHDLRPTIVEKDYVLGWILYAIPDSDVLSKWIFKGGTCLKKCFFETYRFSEDIDFTIPQNQKIDEDLIASGIKQIVEWIESRTGIQFPDNGLSVEKYENKHGNFSYQAKISYRGPLILTSNKLQRIKLDIIQDEKIVEEPELRQIVHMYSDAIKPEPNINCYSVNEILAEKTRALYEREGRARDVYDLVHISRDFREAIDPVRARIVLKQKFDFKKLPEPSVEMIMNRVNFDVLEANWNYQLGHQLPVLPLVKGFFDELHDSIAWWLEPEKSGELILPLQSETEDELIPRQYFPSDTKLGNESINRISYAARNRLCANVRYKGVMRTIEPYSLRRAKTGNILLYGYELERGGKITGKIKAFNINKIESAAVTNQSFAPQYYVEL